MNRKLFFLSAVLLILVFLVLVLQSCNSRSRNILTAEERRWLSSLKRPIRFTPCPDYPPIDYVDPVKGYTGLTSDYVKLIQKQTGIRIKFVLVSDWKELIRKVKKKEVDIVSSIQRTKKREKFLLFTKPYYNVLNVIIVQKSRKGTFSPAEMTGMKIAVTSGYEAERFLRKKYPYLYFIPVRNDRDGLHRLSFGEVDAMVVNLPIATHIINNEGITNLRYAGYAGYTYRIAFGVRKDWRYLRNIFDRALSTINKDERLEISKRWILLEKKDELSDQFWIGVSLISGILIVIILQIVLWNRMLRRQVNQRTDELKRELRERRAIEDSLRDHELMLATLMSSLPGMVYRCKNDEFWTMEFVSDGIVELTGYRPEEVIGNYMISFNDIIHKEDRDYVKMSVDNAIINKRTFEIQYRIIKRNGDERWVYEKGGGIYGNHGEPVSIIGFITDITEVKQKDLQLQQAQKTEMLGTLAGGLAHDFNNVLAAVTGSLAMIDLKLKKLDDSLKEEVQEYTDLIKFSANRAASIMQQLLSLSRKTEIEMHTVDLNTSLKNIHKILSNSIDKSVEIRLHTARESSFVIGDPTMIEQALLNLCVNAAHAMTLMRSSGEHRGGVLTIALENIPLAKVVKDFQKKLVISPDQYGIQSYWAVHVSDTGIGMSPETVRQIFEPFFTTKEKGEGTGLGMVMVYNIVKQHEGGLAVASEPDRGTTVTVFLPEQQKSDDAVSDINDYKINEGSGLVMIVDDDDSVRKVAGAILQECGYRIISVSNGKEAVEIFQGMHESISAVLMDLDMPELSGEEAFKEMREINPLVPVVLTSGFGFDVRVQNALDLGARSFIQKPYTLTALSSVLSEATGKKEG